MKWPGNYLKFTWFATLDGRLRIVQSGPRRRLSVSRLTSLAFCLRNWEQSHLLALPKFPHQCPLLSHLLKRKCALSDDPEETDKMMTPQIEVKEPRKKKKRGRPTFERPPFAKEIFTEETKRVFDNLPGKYRHFVKQLIDTGNPQMAAKLSGIKFLESADEPDRQADVAKLLEQNGLGPDQLIGHLIECVRAEVIIRDKHGNIHNSIDLKTRLQAIEFVFKLNGTFSPKKIEKDNKSLLDMFSSIDPDSNL